VVANWELTLRLQSRREQVGISVQELADHLGFTRNYWSAIVHERKIIPENTLRTLFKVLDIGNEDRRKLLKLRETAVKVDGWWTEYAALLDHEVQRLYGLEHGASEIRNFENILIPGLLQTPAYARAVIRADATIRQVEIEQRVEMRMLRQERLCGDDPLNLSVVISEAALRQQIGGVSVLKGQLDHLAALLEDSPGNIDFRVIPFTATGCNLFGSGTVMLLNFESPRLPTVAWRENVSNWGVIAAAEPVRDLAMAFDQGRTRSLDKRRTLQTVIKCRRELG
jgi:transcriptional regulator with XRE-family HTH domain